MDIAVFNQDVEMQKLLESFGGIVSSKEEKIQSILEHCDEDDEKSLQLKKLLKSSFSLKINDSKNILYPNGKHFAFELYLLPYHHRSKHLYFSSHSKHLHSFHLYHI